VGAFWAFLQTSRAPFEQVFFDWYGGLASQDRAARMAPGSSAGRPRTRPRGCASPSRPPASRGRAGALAECLLPLSDEARLGAAMDVYGPALQEAFAEAILRRASGWRPKA
jgi:hypothetical protein